ncbi:hypothetical protein K491DRAFT_689555 [Lophiostoma macrostomum CBS 122681]|uniref:Uncharacterized protein n=1 Tax=Lophiostoma macrostomum CBS 122681 TaxID=1314788 RepID=A0A6A6TH16_9PLEO|nr:hypothetical protein K491DRAFT_689555 [Lophiostoma macrostomum CBS 122681]
MAPTDPHTGGRLEDMAATGTTIPGDAGVQRIIPSVPRPDQIDPSPAEYSHTNPAHAADNAFDIPRGVADRGQTGEIITGTGDQLTSNIEKKNLDDAYLDPKAKGHARYAKHARQDNEFDKLAKAGHDVESAPGEEEVGQEDLLDRRGAK